MPLRVFAQVDNQSKYRRRKGSTAYRTAFVDQIRIQLNKLLFRAVELFIDQVEQLHEIGVWFIFLFERVQLLRAELVAHKICRQTINAAGNVLSLEAE